MVVAALVCGYAIVLSTLWGALALRLFAALAGLRREPRLRLPVVAAVGLAGVSTFAAYFSLAAGVGLLANLVAIAVAAAYAFADRREIGVWLRAEGDAWRGATPLLLGVTAAAVLFCLERGSMPPSNYDSGRYHAQAIHWIETYGTIAGLANLHLTLASSAGWFQAAALFSMSFLGRSLHLLNAALFLLFVADGARAAAEWRRGARQVSTALRLCWIPFGFSLFAKWLSSPTPDPPVALLTWLIAVLFLEIVERDESGEPGPALAAIALLVAFAVALKMSAAALVLLPLYLLGRALRGGAPRRVAVSAAAAALLLAPAVYRSARVSGYPLFAVAFVDPLDADWKVPVQEMAEVPRGLKAWARWPHRDTGEVLAMAPWQWTPQWFARTRGLSRWALLASLALAPIAAVAGWRNGAAGGRLRRRGAPALQATCLAGVAFWFLTAPDPRFGWGFLVLLPLLLFFTLAEPALRRLPAGAALAALSLFAVGEAWELYLRVPGSLARAGAHLLLPADYPVAPMRPVRAGQVSLFVPTRGDQCWYEPFPCAPLPPPPLELRGADLSDGLRRAR